MNRHPRITKNPAVMGGKPCIVGTRVTVGMIQSATASGTSVEDMLRLYPYLIAADIKAAQDYPDQPFN